MGPNNAKDGTWRFCLERDLLETPVRIEGPSAQMSMAQMSIDNSA
jgi:hypothetical protein